MNNTILTVSPYGFEVEIEVELDEGEPRTWDHPGSGAYASLIDARIKGVSIMEMLDGEQVERFEEAALRAFDLA